jgi:hypothetical protein
MSGEITEQQSKARLFHLQQAAGAILRAENAWRLEHDPIVRARLKAYIAERFEQAKKMYESYTDPACPKIVDKDRAELINHMQKAEVGYNSLFHG